MYALYRNNVCDFNRLARLVVNLTFHTFPYMGYILSGSGVTTALKIVQWPTSFPTRHYQAKPDTQKIVRAFLNQYSHVLFLSQKVILGNQRKENRYIKMRNFNMVSVPQRQLKQKDSFQKIKTSCKG